MKSLGIISRILELCTFCAGWEFSEWSWRIYVCFYLQ